MAATMSELLMNSFTKFIGDNNIDLSYIMMFIQQVANSIYVFGQFSE